MRVLFILISLLCFGSVHSQDAKVPENFQTKTLYGDCLEAIKIEETETGDYISATRCIVMWDGWVSGLTSSWVYNESTLKASECDVLVYKRSTEFAYLFTDWVRDNPQYRDSWIGDSFMFFTKEFC